MLLAEYNEAEAMELFREEGYAEGLVETKAEAVSALMAKLGIAAEQALEALNVHRDERELVIKLLAEHF
jgi:hypothetical protein